MEKVQVNGYAKINLALDIVGKREDGYHEVDMLMNTLALHDVITLEKRDSGIEVHCEGAELPEGEGNIAWRAAALMQKTWPHIGGVSIRIRKRIPVAAGLAGGSADAAAVLEGINQLYDIGASGEELEALAPGLGADVAFSLRKGTARARGIGERLTTLMPLRTLPVLLVKPDISVSTAGVYGQVRLDTLGERVGIDRICDLLKEGAYQDLQENCFNVLEPVTVSMHPEIAEIEAWIRRENPLLCMMSGSGPTVFAIFEDGKQANAMYDACRSRWENCEVILTGTYDGVSDISTSRWEDLCWKTD